MDPRQVKVALVTGASSGIGEATAIRLKDAGFEVWAAARRAERMKGLQQRGIHVLRLDVTEEASRVSGVQAILAAHGRIDLLVNNAGYGSFGAVEDVPIAEAKAQFEVNLFGLARLIQLVLPGMRERRSGRIVNVSSIGGKISEPMGAWYHATKFALEGLSDCLRMELMPFGIDVVIVEPSTIKTEWDSIAAEKMLAVSGNTAYRGAAQMSVHLFESAFEKASCADEVARVIQKAALAKRPCTRYAAGANASSILAARWLLSDRAFDAMMLWMAKKAHAARTGYRSRVRGVSDEAIPTRPQAGGEGRPPSRHPGGGA